MIPVVNFLVHWSVFASFIIFNPSCLQLLKNNLDIKKTTKCQSWKWNHWNFMHAGTSPKPSWPKSQGAKMLFKALFLGLPFSHNLSVAMETLTLSLAAFAKCWEWDRVQEHGGERMGVREQVKKVRWGKAVEDWWLTDRVTGRALVFGELLVLSDQARVPTCRQVSVRIVKPRQTCWQIFANRLQGFVWRWPIHPVTSNSLWVSSHRSSPCLLSVFPSHPNIRVDRKRLSYFFSEVSHFYGDISNVD